jgi:two-component system, LuxR family, response regulator FixJ
MSDTGANRDVFVVDDDGSIRLALQFMLTHAGFNVTSFGDGGTFLGISRERPPACVLLDLCMPGLSGMDVLRQLGTRKYQAPILIMSGMCTIALAVEAVRGGAFDIIQKPFDADRTVARVSETIAATASAFAHEPALPRGQAALTPREREVLTHIADGSSNKETARNLGISPRTIELHRSRINLKLGARNAADLVRIALNGPRIVTANG